MSKRFFIVTISLVACTFFYSSYAAQILGLGGKCLDVKGGNPDDGTPIILWHCTKNDNQKWTFASDDAIRGLAGKCLDVRGGNSADGTPIILWSCTGGNNQKWSITSENEIRGLNGKCLDVRGGNSADGTPIILWPCTGASNQKWAVCSNSLNIGDVDENGQYPVSKCGHDLECSIHKGMNPTNPVDFSDHFTVYFSPSASTVSTCSDCERIPQALAERVGTYYECAWHFYHDPTITPGELTFVSPFGENKEIKGLNGKCLDVKGGASEDGSSIVLWSCHGGSNQKWTVTSDNEIRGLDGKCLDVKGGASEDGTPIILWPCTAKENQKWVFTPENEIRGLGGKCLDVRGGSSEDGTSIILWPCTGGRNQRWSMNSNHLFNVNNSSVTPIWINHCGRSNGTSATPRITVGSTGGVVAPGVDGNALHEYAHLLFKSYNYYINSGYLPFVNEGIPVMMMIPLSHNYVPTNPYASENSSCNLQEFVDISSRSLREYDYCKAANFWYFLALHYTKNIPYEKYQTDMLPEACKVYLSDLDPAMTQMWKLPGRDVIHGIQSEFRQCLPLGMTTVTAKQKNVTHTTYTPICSGKEFFCAGDTTAYPDGCMPDTSMYSQDEIGEVMMPRVMRLVDQALDNRSHPRFHTDGIEYKVFRDWVIFNYKNGGASSSGTSIPPFGAHYHEIDVTLGNWTIDLNKNSGLRDWAYTVVYFTGPFNSEPNWETNDTTTINVTQRNGVEKAVLIITAFSEGGNYSLSKAHHP